MQFALIIRVYSFPFIHSLETLKPKVSSENKMTCNYGKKQTPVLTPSNSPVAELDNTPQIWRVLIDSTDILKKNIKPLHFYLCKVSHHSMEC